MSEPTNSRQEPTTIHWLTLPRNGNGGAALVTWRRTTDDSSIDGNVWRTLSIGYLLGAKPPRYPLPAINKDEWPQPFCLFCGSLNNKCNLFPMDCMYNQMTRLRFSLDLHT